jgi:dTDP-4-dehydro-6-deoxy-alpha-D-glucopyranose 2,3-dehydratase
MIKSALTTNNIFNDLEEIRQWLQRRNEEVNIDIQKIKFSELKNWKIDEDGSLRHESHKFFSIQGIQVKTDFGTIPSWDQPIIYQPEIGYLGILAKEINGVLYFLMQAKIEPGNVNYVQLSPTLQATKSNYSRVHKGKIPAYLDYFVNAKPHQVLLDQLQSEQGARFLRKRNRNIIIKVDEEVEVLEDFRWMTIGQIKELIYIDNMVNMDTRTVISGIEYANYLTPLIKKEDMSKFGSDMLKSAILIDGLHNINEHLSWLTNLKSSYDLYVSYKPINKLNDWEFTDDEIVHQDGKYFKIIGISVSISNREVTSWCQPIVQPMQQGLCAFILKKIGDVYHFLVQAKLECGNYDVLELAPTVQCLTGNVFESVSKPPFVDFVLNVSKDRIRYDVLQSEEGGRFYREQNRNMIVEADDAFSIEVPDNYTWMTYKQINEFLRFNNFLNIQARSLLAAIKYI